MIRPDRTLDTPRYISLHTVSLHKDVDTAGFEKAMVGDIMPRVRIAARTVAGFVSNTGS